MDWQFSSHSCSTWCFFASGVGNSSAKHILYSQRIVVTSATTNIATRREQDALVLATIMHKHSEKHSFVSLYYGKYASRAL